MKKSAIQVWLKYLVSIDYDIDELLEYTPEQLRESYVEETEEKVVSIKTVTKRGHIITIKQVA